MKKTVFTFLLLLQASISLAQDHKVTRIARITVDSSQLKAYTALLQEQMYAAIKNEPGVISYNVYADKLLPQRITIVEVYADNNAYLQHRGTAHFKKYKQATKDMVLSLELAAVDPLLEVKK